MIRIKILKFLLGQIWRNELSNIPELKSHLNTHVVVRGKIKSFCVNGPLTCHWLVCHNYSHSGCASLVRLERKITNKLFEAASRYNQENTVQSEQAKIRVNSVKWQDLIIIIFGTLVIKGYGSVSLITSRSSFKQY